MKQYTQDVESIPSVVLQCQMLVEKVRTREKGKNGPTLLLAMLAGTVVDKLSKTLTNYAGVLLPLREILAQLIFSSYVPDRTEDCSSGSVPYYAITTYFAKKMKQYESEKEDMDRKLAELRRRRVLIECFADRYASLYGDVPKPYIGNGWNSPGG